MAGGATRGALPGQHKTKMWCMTGRKKLLTKYLALDQQAIRLLIPSFEDDFPQGRHVTLTICDWL